MRARALCVGLVLFGLAATPSALADPPPLLGVTMSGPHRVRVQASFGRVMPCDSSPLVVDQAMEPGDTVAIPIPADQACACVRHTSEAFPDSDWQESHVICRANNCIRRWYGGCWIAQVPLDITLRSDSP